MLLMYKYYICMHVCITLKLNILKFNFSSKNAKTKRYLKFNVNMIHKIPSHLTF